jgi:hypothetical protein
VKLNFLVQTAGITHPPIKPLTPALSPEGRGRKRLPLCYLAAYLVRSVLSAYPKSGCGANTGAVSRDFSDSLLVQVASITRPPKEPLTPALSQRGEGDKGGTIWPHIYRDLYLVQDDRIGKIIFIQCNPVILSNIFYIRLQVPKIINISQNCKFPHIIISMYNYKKIYIYV